MTKALGKDETDYRIVTKLQGTLDGGKAEATDIRSFQTMLARVTKNPGLARTLIHKPGPLSDCTADEIKEYAGVFTRGLEEVGAVIGKVKVKVKAA